VLLDVGANLECRPEHLVGFARLGSAYARVRLGVDRPRVGLLSIGEEAGKGTDLIRAAHRRLSAANLHFVGNVEARDLFAGIAEVVVCDGFTGNIALKVGEGLAEAMGGMIRAALGSDDDSSGGGDFRRRLAQELGGRLDSAEHGAAPLLGLEGLVLVGHGRSSARAVQSGIRLAAELARAGTVALVREAISDRAQVRH
jgi:glycerol-3-phosphate acyltransferase PlsX